ncbi:MAG TPA: hypothetical protein P5218_08230, partial [Planctomycetota bacterium]|nr:hypothetical protein [Planctomycetota bacterium]
MNTNHKAALLGVLATLVSACSETRGSIQPDPVETTQAMQIVESPAEQYLHGFEGTYDVVYKVYNRGDQGFDSFQGLAQYQWDANSQMLMGTHDSMWGSMPFQGTLMVGCNSSTGSFSLGWAKPDGTIVQSMQAVERQGLTEEFSVPRYEQGQATRTVMVLEDNNVHFLRR